MKNFTSGIGFILLVSTFSFGQGGFNKVVDSLNPVTIFTSPGVYKGAAWIDYDNDGDIDLFAAPNHLFRNDGNGSFTEINNPFGFTPAQNPGGSSWADLNDDGTIDCIIAQYPSGVFLNNGSGTFTNISSQVDSLNGFPSWACAIGNWNNDAYPDFVFAHAANFHPAGPFPSKLYLNNSASVIPLFITCYTLTDSVNPYTVPYWSDYDLDGDMDLFVASGPGGSPGPDFCYKNLKVETGLDTLERMSTELFAAQLQDGQCYNFIDFDHDGDLDLCLTNYHGASSRFYINDNGNYNTFTLPFTSAQNNLANDWGDFDNDGEIDVIITNDQLPTRFFRNNGDSTFAPAVNIGAAGGSGISNGDYDNDGDLDFFVHGAGNARALFRNDSAATGNHWISIRCTGTTSNSSAIGAIIRLKATIHGKAYWQIREINAQNSFQSQNDLRVHFGLGDAVVADSLAIRYPSGAIETFTNVQSDVFYCNEEGTGSLCLVNKINDMKSDLNFSIYPNPVKDVLNISFTGSGNSETEFTICDVCGKVLLNKKYSASKNHISISTNDLTPGTYLLKMKKGAEEKSLKFLKE